MDCCACDEVLVTHGGQITCSSRSDCQAHRKDAKRNEIWRRCCSIRTESGGNKPVTVQHLHPKNCRKILFNVKLWELRPLSKANTKPKWSKRKCISEGFRTRTQCPHHGTIFYDETSDECSNKKKSNGTSTKSMTISKPESIARG